jgi:hypothetical protein
MRLISFSEKYHVNYHDVQTLHYLSQGYPPKETQQQLQNHFEAWKVYCRKTASQSVYSHCCLCIPVWLGGVL